MHVHGRAAGAVVAMFWNNTDGGEHPIHLHGHPFFLTSSSDNVAGVEQKYAPHFLRRDVGTVSADGWAKYIFVADYASVIMIHCHIGARGSWAGMAVAPEAIAARSLHPHHHPTPTPPHPRQTGTSTTACAPSSTLRPKSSLACRSGPVTARSARSSSTRPRTTTAKFADAASTVAPVVSARCHNWHRCGDLPADCATGAPHQWQPDCLCRLPADSDSEFTNLKGLRFCHWH